MDQVEGQVLVLEHVDDAVQREVGVVQEVDHPTAFAVLDWSRSSCCFGWC